MFFRIAAAVFIANDRETFAKSGGKIDKDVLHGWKFTTEEAEVVEKEKTNRRSAEILRDLRVLCG